MNSQKHLKKLVDYLRDRYDTEVVEGWVGIEEKQQRVDFWYKETSFLSLFTYKDKDSEGVERRYELTRKDHVNDDVETGKFLFDFESTSEKVEEYEVDSLLSTFKFGFYESASFSVYNMENGLRIYLPNASEIDMEKVEDEIRNELIDIEHMLETDEEFHE